MFEGKDCIDQFNRFVAVLGKPKKEIYEKIDPEVKNSFEEMINDMPDRSKIDWRILFPSVPYFLYRLMKKA